MSFYEITNPITYQAEYFDTEEQANNKLAENKVAYLLQESYRFNICKEVVDGNNTIWSSADLDNDPEDGLYKVFNHTIGSYEDVQGLSNAKIRMQQLKNEFFDSSYYSKYKIIDEIPSNTGYISGQMNAPIPVKVM